MAQAFQTAPPWTAMPMPAGWEAKYEPSVGRYFYINHSTKKTQWVDPRQALYDAQQRRPQQMVMQPIAKPKCKVCKTTDVDSAGLTCQSCKVAQQQREISLMRAREQMEEEKRRQEQQAKLDKERERRRVQSAKRREERTVQETTFGEDQTVDKEALKAEIAKMFPTTDKTIREMLLETCDWDKTKAIQALCSVGEKQVKVSPKKAATPKPASTASSSTPAAPPPKVLSKAEKLQMKARLKKAYPHASDLMINMALDTTKFNEQLAMGVLNMLKDDGPSAPGNAGQSASNKMVITFPDTMPSTTVTTQQADSRSAPRGAAASSQRPVTTTTTSTASRGGSAESAASLSAVKVTVPAVSPKRAQIQQPKVAGSPAKKAAQVPGKKMAAKKAAKKSPAGAKYAAPATRSTPAFTSSYSTTAKGRDPTLVKGPNLANLIDHYQPETGPNKENVHGPERENAVGPVGGTGRDHTMASGPDSANLSGPERGLAKGSMYQNRRQGPTTTNL